LHLVLCVTAAVRVCLINRFVLLSVELSPAEREGDGRGGKRERGRGRNTHWHFRFRH